MGYEHVQYGYQGFGAVVSMAFIGMLTLPDTFAESSTTGMALAGVLVAASVLVAWFSRLAVTIEDATVSASFGVGWPKKGIDLSDVVRVEPVRSNWVQGWGVRKIPGGWMYNVWGLDAIELEMTSGELARIGTNDAENLLASVRVYTG